MGRSGSGPYAAKRKLNLAAIGDSYIANGQTQNSTTVNKQSNGWLWWALQEARQPFNTVSVAGVSGESTSQIAVRLPAVLATNPDVVLIQGGSNDAAGAAATKANLLGMYQSCLAAGKKVIACTIPPDNTATSQQKIDRAAVNAWLKLLASQLQDFYLVDWTTLLGDTNGNFIIADGVTVALSQDGRHPNTLAARQMGRLLARTFTYIAGSNIVDPLPCLNANDAGQILTNPLQFGTTGTVNTGGSGSAPTGWTAGRVSGSGGPNDALFAVSKVARTDFPNLTWTQLVISSQGSGSTNGFLGGAQLFQFCGGINTKWAAADGFSYVGMVEWEADAFTTATRGPLLEIKCMDSGFAVLLTATALAEQFDTGPTAGTANQPYYPLGVGGNDQLRSGVFQTLPFTIPALTANLLFQVNFFAVGTLRIGRCDLRRVVTVP